MDGVRICFGSRVRSDGFLRQYVSNGAEFNCKVTHREMEAVQRGSRMGCT